MRVVGGVDALEKINITDTPTTTPTKNMQTTGAATAEEGESEDSIKQQLELHIAACETKIRMLRATIADLSEENARNLVQVERRGLSGGIKLIRGEKCEVMRERRNKKRRRR